MSVEYLTLVASGAGDLQPRVFEHLRQCEATAARDYECAVKIQRRWRGYRDRKYIQYITTQSTHIQRIYRGYCGRQRFLEELRARNRAVSLALYSSMATKIQKVIRGYLSRKYAQDLYARRAYITSVAEQGTQLDRAADEQLERQILDADAARVEARSQRFEQLTTNIHHLIGTRAIPSVFQSRLGAEYDATAFDIPMETHIREAFVNRQAHLRQMREHLHASPASKTVPSKSTAQQQQPRSSPQHALHYHRSVSRNSTATPAAAVAVPHSIVVQPSPPPATASFTSPHRTGSAVSRSRPSSGARLAPLASPPSNRSASAAPSFTSTHPGVSLDATLPLTQKLPSVRVYGVSSPVASASGRTLSATELYASQVPGGAFGDVEEKQQVPLALALGGHVSTTPSRASSKAEGGPFAATATRPLLLAQPPLPTAAKKQASPQRKWTQPTKVYVPHRTEVDQRI